MLNNKGKLVLLWTVLNGLLVLFLYRVLEPLIFKGSWIGWTISLSFALMLGTFFCVRYKSLKTISIWISIVLFCFVCLTIPIYKVLSNIINPKIVFDFSSNVEKADFLSPIDFKVGIINSNENFGPLDILTIKITPPPNWSSANTQKIIRNLGLKEFQEISFHFKPENPCDEKKIFAPKIEVFLEDKGDDPISSAKHEIILHPPKTELRFEVDPNNDIYSNTVKFHLHNLGQEAVYVKNFRLRTVASIQIFRRDVPAGAVNYEEFKPIVLNGDLRKYDLEFLKNPKGTLWTIEPGKKEGFSALIKPANGPEFKALMVAYEFLFSFSDKCFNSKKDLIGRYEDNKLFISSNYKNAGYSNSSDDFWGSFYQSRLDTLIKHYYNTAPINLLGISQWPKGINPILAILVRTAKDRLKVAKHLIDTINRKRVKKDEKGHAIQAFFMLLTGNYELAMNLSDFKFNIFLQDKNNEEISKTVINPNIIPTGEFHPTNSNQAIFRASDILSPEEKEIFENQLPKLASLLLANPEGPMGSILSFWLSRIQNHEIQLKLKPLLLDERIPLLTRFYMCVHLAPVFKEETTKALETIIFKLIQNPYLLKMGVQTLGKIGSPKALSVLKKISQIPISENGKKRPSTIFDNPFSFADYICAVSNVNNQEAKNLALELFNKGLNGSDFIFHNPSCANSWSEFLSILKKKKDALKYYSTILRLYLNANGSPENLSNYISNKRLNVLKERWEKEIENIISALLKENEELDSRFPFLAQKYRSPNYLLFSNLIFKYMLMDLSPNGIDRLEKFFLITLMKHNLPEKVIGGMGIILMKIEGERKTFKLFKPIFDHHKYRHIRLKIIDSMSFKFGNELLLKEYERVILNFSRPNFQRRDLNYIKQLVRQLFLRNLISLDEGNGIYHYFSEKKENFLGKMTQEQENALKAGLPFLKIGSSMEIEKIFSIDPYIWKPEKLPKWFSVF